MYSKRQVTDQAVSVELIDAPSGSWKNRIIERAKNDPIWFIENVLGDTLWSKQREICEKIVKKDKVNLACKACFDDTTEIFTETRGWQLFKDLCYTDKVATLVNEKVVFEKPKNYFEYDYEGEMIGCKTKQLDFLVTPEHRCYSRYGNYSKSGLSEYEISTAEELYNNNRSRSFYRGVNFFENKSVAFRKKGNKEHIVSKHGHWYKQQYKGKVYCVETTPGVVLVRRNGVYHWSGQSFGVGKSFLLARLALWFLFTHSPSKVITTSATGRQVREILWSEIRTAHAKSKLKLGGRVLTTQIQLQPDHFAVGFSTDLNMDMFTGYHSPNIMVIFDQAGGIPPMVWDAAEGLMTSSVAKWVAMSNTAVSDCEFANICMPDRKTTHGEWEIVTITAKESPNIAAGKDIFPGILSHGWLAEKEKIWDKSDPLYKIFVLAEFVSASEMAVLTSDMISSMFSNEGEMGIDLVVGLDVARQGLDSTVWFVRSGTRALEVKRVTGNDTMQVVGITVEYCKELQERYQLPVRFVNMDIIGIGAGINDRLVELNFPVQGVNNAEQKIVSDKERYANVRAEMAWSFRRRAEINGVGLGFLESTEDPNLIRALREDMQVMKYKLNSSGKILIWEKDDIKAILGRSPDYWDAMIMSYEIPGAGLPALDYIQPERNVVQDEKYEMSKEEWMRLFGMNVSAEDPSFR